jgi:hypothetical protein
VVGAVKAAAGKGGVAPATRVDYPSGLENRGTEYGEEHRGGVLGRTKEELARLQNRTVITSESEPMPPIQTSETSPRASRPGCR